MDPGLDGLERALVVEVHVGHNRHIDLAHHLFQCLGVLALRHGHAHDVGTSLGVAVDLGDAGIDVMRVAGVHGLHDDGCAATDAHAADAVVADDDLTGDLAGSHGPQSVAPRHALVP